MKRFIGSALLMAILSASVASWAEEHQSPCAAAPGAEAAAACLNAIETTQEADRAVHLDALLRNPVRLLNRMEIEGLQPGASKAERVKLAAYPAYRYTKQSVRADITQLNGDIALARTFGDKLAEARLQIQRASLFLSAGNGLEAREAGERGLMLSRDIDWAQGKIICLNGLAVVATREGNYADALESYQAALALADQEDSLLQANIIQMNIGVIFRDIGDYEAAESVFLSVIEAYDAGRPHSPHYRGMALGNLGTVYTLQGEHDVAVEIYKAAIQAELQSERTSVLGYTNFWMAKSLDALGNRQTAIETAERSLSQTINDRDPSEAAGALNWLALRYLEDGDVTRARTALERAAELMQLDPTAFNADSVRGKDAYFLMENSRGMAEAFRQLGETDKAMDYASVAMMLSDNRFEIEKLNAVANAELMFNLRQQNNEIRLLEQASALSALSLSRQRARATLGFTIAGALALLIILAGVAYRDQQRALQTRDLLLRDMQHRVRNNLQIIQSLLNRDAKRRAGDTNHEAVQRLQAMALVHDHLYTHDRNLLVEVGDFLPELLDGLAEGEARPDVDIHHRICTAELDVDIAVPLGLLLCEIVSNALKHAFHGTAGVIEVCLEQANDELELTIVDDGIGFDVEAIRGSPSENGSGLGLSLVEDLIAQMGAHGTVTSDKSGTRWTIIGVKPKRTKGWFRG